MEATLVERAASKAPVAVFAYRRVDALRRLLRSLAASEDFAETNVTVFVDGWKDERDRPDVEAVRDFVQNLPFPNVRPSISYTNLGLKRSVFEGVSELVRQCGRVVVLEDDLVVSPAALRYFNDALHKYSDNSRVWSISGYIYDTPHIQARNSAFFLPFATSWGWATWERAWTKFNIEAGVPTAMLESRSFRRAFSMNGLSDFGNMLELARNGKIDSWYIWWYFEIFRNGGLSLFPPRTLVENRGFAMGDGTHAGVLNPYRFIVRPQPFSLLAPVLPEDVFVDYNAMDVIPQSWEARVIRGIHRLGSIKRKMRRGR